MTLGPAVHHVGARRPCAVCGTRVFTYATAADGAHYCTMCADRLRGATLCRFCQRPIIEAGGGWAHRDRTVFAIRHPAEPEKNLRASG